MNEKLRMLFTDWLGYIAVALVSVIYVLSALFVPGLTGKSVGTIIAEGAMGFILGMSMNCNFKLQGILKGKRSEELIATRREHAKAVESIVGEIEYLESWCEERNVQKLRERRTHILTMAGLHYKDFFDDEGNARAFECALSREQALALKRARRTKISRLSTAALTCDGEDAEDPFNFGETPAQYQRRTNITDAFSKLLTALVFGYFGVDTVENFDLAALAWRALFVALLLALGVAKQVSAYLFVTDTYRGNIVKKINHLQAYKNCAADYARCLKEEYNNARTGQLQDPAAGGDRSEEEKCPAAGIRQSPNAAQIFAEPDQGAEPRNDRDGGDRGGQLLCQSAG